MIDSRKKYTARIDSNVEPWVKELMKEIAVENNCYLSDIYREAIYEWIYKYERKNKISEKKSCETMDSVLKKDDKATVNLSVAIPRELMKC